MADAPFDIARAHHWFAVEFNNSARDLLEYADRSDDDMDRMIHLAHAALLHWEHAGEPINRLRALTLLADAYSAANRPHEALRYGQQCRELQECGVADVTPFDRAMVFECNARAIACAGDSNLARRVRAEAVAAADGIESADDRKVFDDLLTMGEWFGLD